MTENTEPLVLIVEDNKMFRDMAFNVFNKTERVMAKDASEGLQKFKEISPDITLLDIGLPDKSGLDILPEMIEYNPEAFIVMLTKSNLKKDVEQAKKSGAIGYISKPFSYNKVEECIELYKQHKKELEERQKEKESTPNALEEQEKITKKEEALIQDALYEQEVKKLTLLFVDDNYSNRYKAQKLLSQLGCKLDIAKNGAEAFDIYKRHHSNIILIDSIMDDISGYDVAKKIRNLEKKKKLKKSIIIAMPENNDEINDKLWQEAGMDTFITKPAKVYEVKEIIKKYIEDNLGG